MPEPRTRLADRPLTRRQLFLLAGVAGALAGIAGGPRRDAEAATAAAPPDYRAIVGLL